jgi:hypothetical protein
LAQLLWIPERETVTEILGYLAGIGPVPGIMNELDHELLALWLVNNDLAALAQTKFRDSAPELAARLQAEMFSIAAANTVHWHYLRQIDDHLANSGIPVLLLKGAALAEAVYEGPEQRAMADVDLWVQKQHFAQACAVMAELGFRSVENAARPLELQALAGGEVQYLSSDQSPTLVELHLSPFSGWWLQRTTAIDLPNIWARRKQLDGWDSFSQLSAEDAVIHMAVHLAVNHQFGLTPLRGLVDIVMTDQVRQVDWSLLAGRAQRWRVATAVWLVLAIAQQLTGATRFAEAVDQLQPSSWRRRRLQQLVSADSILAGQDIRNEQQRYAYLLLLVDRPRDAGRLMARTLWPEGEWLDARYGGGVDHWEHIRRLIVQGGI